MNDDPLKNPAFRPPGIWESLRNVFLGVPRPLDCLQVEVTSVCSGRCAYCPHTTQREQWKSRNMDAQTYAALWPLLRQAARVHLQGWGEPLLHSRFLDFAALALRAGCRVSTTTSGLRMDESLAEGLVTSGIDVIAFSLVGTDSQSNAARAGIPFETVTKAIRILQSVREKHQAVHLEVHLAYLLLASQLDAVAGLPRLMEELGIHAAVISTLDYIPSPELAKEAFQPEETARLAAARKVLEQTRQEAEARGLSLYYALPSSTPAPGCRENAGRTAYVDADGVLSPCVYVNVPVTSPTGACLTFGNVNAGNPVDLWNASSWVEFRQALSGPLPPAPCRLCPKRFETPG